MHSELAEVLPSMGKIYGNVSQSNVPCNFAQFQDSFSGTSKKKSSRLNKLNYLLNNLVFIVTLDTHRSINQRKEWN